MTKEAPSIERSTNNSTIWVEPSVNSHYWVEIDSISGDRFARIRLPKQDALDIARFIIKHCEKDTVT